MEACRYASRYKGSRKPRCNEGRGCDSCLRIYAKAQADRPLTVTLLGKRYKLTHVRMTRQNGLCDAPHKAGKKIRVNRGLSEPKRLEILIHEMLHATNWSLDEWYVEHIARDMSRVLFKLGYKCE